MSASRTPTSRPSAASAAARLTESDDLPTPPLPEATASTRVFGESRMPFVSAPPRSFSVRAARSSGDITSKCSATCDTPGNVPTCSATWSSKLDRKGQPTTVSAIVTETSEPSIAISRTMSSSVTGRRSSGSITRPSAARICSWVGTVRGYRLSRAGRPTAARRAPCSGRQLPASARRGRAAPTRTAVPPAGRCKGRAHGRAAAPRQCRPTVLP